MRATQENHTREPIARSTLARHSAKSGWTVQRIMRVIQLNLFDRRSLLQSILMPAPLDHKKSEPQMRLAL